MSTAAIDEVLAGRAPAGRDDLAAVAGFVTDLRASFAGETSAAVLRLVKPGRTRRRAFAFALVFGAGNVLFGGAATAGALPDGLQHTVARVADRVGIGFVPDPQEDTPAGPADGHDERRNTTPIDADPTPGTIETTTRTSPSVPAVDDDDRFKSSEPTDTTRHESGNESSDEKGKSPDDPSEPGDDTQPSADDPGSDEDDSSGTSDGEGSIDDRGEGSDDSSSGDSGSSVDDSSEDADASG